MNAEFKKLRLEGESNFLPNLKFKLSDILLRAIQTAITDIETKTLNPFWFGPYLLQKSNLSMQSLDLLNVISFCNLTSENELEIYRLKKNALMQLEVKLLKSKNFTKQKNLKQLIALYSDIKVASSTPAQVSLETHLEKPKFLL